MLRKLHFTITSNLLQSRRHFGRHFRFRTFGLVNLLSANWLTDKFSVNRLTMNIPTLDPHLTRVLRSIRAHNPNSISIGSAVFAQMTIECPYTSQWDALFPSKLPFPCGESGPPSNTCFTGHWAHPSPQPKRHLDQCSRFCRAH